MSQHDDFDRSLTWWFEAEARPAATADVLDRALRATRRRRPRPRLFATIGSHWVGNSVGPTPGAASLGRTGVRSSMALLLLVLALVAGAVMVGARMLQPVPPSDDLGIFAPVAGWIVYGDSDGIWGVDPAAPVAVTRVPLTSKPGNPLGWSSDGTRLLIMRGSRDEGRLFILHADGSETQVTERPWSIAGATISPDGSRVVFAGATSDKGSALYAVDADGGSAEILAVHQGSSIRAPAYAPDGTRIAYTYGSGDHSHHVWVIGADGSDAHEIVYNERTAAAGHVRGLAWSPAGDRIALGLEGTIYTFATDGSGFTQIAGGDTTCDASDPCAVKLPQSAESSYWSPDGSQVAYTTGCVDGAGAANRDGCHLAIADADGSNVLAYGFPTAGPWHPAPTTSDETSPAPTADPTPAPSPLASRRGGEVIGFRQRETGPGWDLVAWDPETGEARMIVDTDGIVDCPDASSCRNFVRRAEWSPDGRSVAFQVSHTSLDGAPLGPCRPTLGIWVASAPDGLRQLTTPCAATPGAVDVEELWAWSPDGARLAVARVDGPSDELIAIDPSDRSRTLLATDVGDLIALAWSPDGARIAFANGSSVYEVAADGGRQAPLADSFVDIIDIAWSPDGSRILVHDQGRFRIQVMNADGSDLRVVLEGEDACCSTAWSPAGDRILYMLSVVRPEEPSFGGFDSQVWTVSPDGSDAVEVFDSAGCGMGDMGVVGDSLPVWAPGGTQVAYNACGAWVTENADGSGERRAVGGGRNGSGGPPLLHRAWEGGGLSQWDLALIGQVDH